MISLYIIYYTLYIIHYTLYSYLEGGQHQGGDSAGQEEAHGFMPHLALHMAGHKCRRRPAGHQPHCCTHTQRCVSPSNMQASHAVTNRCKSLPGLSDAFHAIFELHMVSRHVLYILHLVRKAAQAHHSGSHDNFRKVLCKAL